MELSAISPLLKRVKGVSFVSLSAETYPKPGVRKVEEGTTLLLWSNHNGYEDMVNRRLEAEGMRPSFIAGELPWGRHGKLPGIILHKDQTYLRGILIREGGSKYYVGKQEVDPSLLSAFGIKRDGLKTNQGLPIGQEVLVRCYDLSRIRRLVAFGETVEG